MKMKYELYIGLWSLNLHSIEEFDSYQEAIETAYEYACDMFESYAGLHGIPSLSCISEEMISEGLSETDPDWDKELEERYFEARENWIRYEANPVG